MTHPKPHKPHDVAVYIGRFQPFHLGHLAMLQQALAAAQHVVVVIGSAHQARSPKNPWTWQEREHLIRQAIAPADQARVHMVPIRDWYHMGRWVADVQHQVHQTIERISTQTDKASSAHNGNVALVGHFKDGSSGYLQHFANWHLLSLPRANDIDATPLRTSLFQAAAMLPKKQTKDQTIAATHPIWLDMAKAVPPTTQQHLQQWVQSEAFECVLHEWQALQAHKQSWAGSPYPPVFVTVDAVVRCQGHVLLIQRKHAPGKGLMAIPGGFIDINETAYQSALRELTEETQINISAHALNQAHQYCHVFDHPTRSQRGRGITHTFYFDLGNDHPLPEVTGADDARLAQWVHQDQLVQMESQFFDDHFLMLHQQANGHISIFKLSEHLNISDI